MLLLIQADKHVTFEADSKFRCEKLSSFKPTINFLFCFFGGIGFANETETLNLKRNSHVIIAPKNEHNVNLQPQQ